MADNLDKLIISKDKLELLFEKNRKYIGRKALISGKISIGLTTITTVFVSEFKDVWFIPADIIKTMYIIVSIVMFVLAIHTIWKNKITHKTLFNKAIELSEVENEYRAIIVLRDEFNSFSNKYLVYYDTVWNCYLCLHYSYNPKNEETESVSAILNRVSNELFIEHEFLSGTSICIKDSCKHSYRTNETKFYHFHYYSAIINADHIPELLKQDQFEINDKKYYWKSIEELRNHRNTWERNSDVINFLESHVWE